MIRLKLFLCLLVVALSGCAAGRSVATQTVTLFAAASLTNAFDELAAAFERDHDGVQVVRSYAGSSQLAAQLAEGARADLFASADAAQLTAVIAAGRIEAGAAVPFASNRLTVIVPADNPAGIVAWEDLGRADVQLLLAAEGVPIRAYTDAVVAAQPASFQAQFYRNVVSEEDNVRQVVAKIALGEADAGIVYTSDVTPDLGSRVRPIPIPTAANVRAAYFIAPLADAPHPELARQFTTFLLSAEGQRILAQWGFGPAAAPD